MYFFAYHTIPYQTIWDLVHMDAFKYHKHIKLWFWKYGLRESYPIKFPNTYVVNIDKSIPSWIPSNYHCYLINWCLMETYIALPPSSWSTLHCPFLSLQGWISYAVVSSTYSFMPQLCLVIHTLSNTIIIVIITAYVISYNFFQYEISCMHNIPMHYPLSLNIPTSACAI